MKTEHKTIDAILEKATKHLENLRLSYNAEKESDILDNYTEEAKKAYLKTLSQTYYGKGKEIQKQYIEQISNEYDSLIRIEKENQRIKELRDKEPKTQEQLLSDTNKLLYSTFILNNGTVDQMKNLLEQYGNDAQIIELIRAKLNTVGREEKNRYNDVHQKIFDLTRDKVNDLLMQKNSYQNNLSSDSFPTTNALQPDLAQIFEKTKYMQDEFFK